MALVINAAIIAFVLPPFNDWLPEYQIMLFICLEACALTVKALCHAVLGNEPDDVRLTRYINDKFKQRIGGYATVHVPDSDIQDTSKIREVLGLPPPTKERLMTGGGISILDKAGFEAYLGLSHAPSSR